jgi:AcrR family transcriptional regulator
VSPAAREPQAVESPTREAILKEASILFAELGYARTSLALVADALGITRQAFYYHFKTKGDILAALFDRAMSLVEAEVEQRLLKQSQPQYLELLSGHLQVVLDNIDVLKITTHERPSINHLSIGAEERRAAYARNFIKAFREGVATGQLWPGVPRVVVLADFGMINAITTWWTPGQPAAEVLHEEILVPLRRGLVIAS